MTLKSKLLNGIILFLFFFNKYIIAECGKTQEFEMFCKKADFVGLVVYTGTFSPFENAKFFRVVDLIKGHDTSILVMDSYGCDDREIIHCGIGDTILLAANKRNREVLIDLTLISVIERPPVYYLPPCTDCYFIYSLGYCYYIHKPDDARIEYKTLLSKLELMK